MLYNDATEVAWQLSLEGDLGGVLQSWATFTQNDTELSGGFFPTLNPGDADAICLQNFCFGVRELP